MIDGSSLPYEENVALTKKVVKYAHKYDATFAKLVAVTMVKVKYNLRLLPAKLLCILHSTLGHVAEKCLVGVVAGSLGHLEDNRRLCLCCSLNDGLELLHIVKVECRNGVTTLNCLGDHLARNG